MKKIYSIFLTAIATLFFASAVSAQTKAEDYSINGQIKDPINGSSLVFPNDNGLHIDTENKVAHSKNVSKPFKDGTYWIKLETFATGSASYTVSNEPADIVLVLDFSSSMNQTGNSYLYPTGDDQEIYVPVTTNRQANYQSAGNPQGAFDYNNIQNITRYARFNGKYYQVYGGRVNGNSGNYFLYFEADGTRYYLDHDHITDVMPTTYTTQYQAYWGGALYDKQTGNTTRRILALKEAVAEFIDVIYHNDNYESDYPSKEKPRTTPLGNRISVVIYSTESASQRLVGWTNVTTNTGYKDESILQPVARVTTYNNATHSDTGMSLANALLSEIDPTRMSQSSRTVVLFTDGAPGESQNWSDPVSTNVANQCIANAKTTKATTENNGYDATVFSVLVFSGTMTSNMTNYMNGVSSNYPNAESLTSLGARCDNEEVFGENKKDPVYYKEAGDDLSGVFVDIAHQSGGNANTSLNSASSAVDVVSNSFILPDGADADHIGDYVKIFTAKLEKMENGKYIFYPEIMKNHSDDEYYTYDKNGNQTGGPFDIDDNISVSLVGKNGIKVTNFDYSSNWCGPVYKTDGETIDHYQGHKIIIMIPIKMNPDAVGGPNVSTNGEGSGIFVKDTDTKPLVPFVSPTVSLPVNMYLEKIGLNPGESAKFRIERAEIPNTPNWDPATFAESAWTFVSTVFVTNSPNTQTSKDGNPMVKVRGMPATITKDEDNDGEPDVDPVTHEIIQIPVVYRIVEENWGWSYKILNTEEYPNPQYTVTSKVDNPFSFKNEKKDHIELDIRHAESKATNIFKTVDEGKENVQYDDSKPRKTKTQEGGSN